MANLADFIEWCQEVARSTGNPVAQKVVDIFRNVDATNRQGHIKQSFYGIQAFFDEDPERLTAILLTSAMTPFQLQRSNLRTDWVRFLRAHVNDPQNPEGASIGRLRQVLNRRLGGVQTRGGGGDYELKIVATLAARYLAVIHYRP